MDNAIAVVEASQQDLEVYPDKFDITTYENGRWHYAASFPDANGTYREVYLTPRNDGGWSVRVFEHVGEQKVQGQTVSTWDSGLLVDLEADGRLSYVRARTAAAAWLSDGCVPRS